MKTFPLVLLMTALVFIGQAAFAQSEQDLLNEAQRAYLQGDVDAAKQKFNLVVEMDPHNMIAQRYLGMIAVQEKSSDNPGASREKQLSNLILPHVDLKDASFSTALDYLKQSAAKLGQKDVSFVVQVPPDVAAAKTVTLSLSDIPFTEVLRYLGQLTGFKFTIDKYAIVVKQPEAVSEPSASAAPSPATP